MAETNFVDYVKIFCRSGKGGRGSTHFRREKYIPKGGPDGGNGGDGGDIILRGNRNYWTLLHLKFQRHIFAGHGESGSRRNSTGKNGESRIIEVPCGTVAYDAHTGEYLCDITDDGQEVILLKGGRGGLGNTSFKTSTNQAPRYSQPGEPYQERWVVLELKLLADVGLVGFPNAGKSTLLSVVSAAKPKIGNYPFTTLEPNLGIVSYREGKSFVMADIPGIIEGASEGKGLGLRFLRHIERNSLLLFMVPADAEIIRDSVYKHDEKTVNIDIEVVEGPKYYVRSINWVGNTQYNSNDLGRMLNMNPGDVYNQKKLQERLISDEDAAINLYQNNGYLFSNIDPISSIKVMIDVYFPRLSPNIL
jgi:GTP-binding protein